MSVLLLWGSICDLMLQSACRHKMPTYVGNSVCRHLFQHINMSTYMSATEYVGIFANTRKCVDIYVGMFFNTSRMCRHLNVLAYVNILMCRHICRLLDMSTYLPAQEQMCWHICGYISNLVVFLTSRMCRHLNVLAYVSILMCRHKCRHQDMSTYWQAQKQMCWHICRHICSYAGQYVDMSRCRQICRHINMLTHIYMPTRWDVLLCPHIQMLTYMPTY